MISFKILPVRHDVSVYLNSVKESFSSIEALTEIGDLLSGYYDLEGEGGHAEVAVSISCGCFLIRIYEYDYAFVCPIPINEDADITAAADEIRRYAIKEEITLVFIDVYEDDVSAVAEPFRFTSIHPMDESGEVMYVAPCTEAQHLEEIPSIEGEGIVLDALCEEDISEYARLCRHEEVNRLYGNDYRDDFGEEISDDRFFSQAEDEVSFGLSVIFAIRHEGRLAGEASIFAFDYVGGAKVAIRLLPEFWGKGLGSRALEILLNVAREIELKRVSTAVKKENVASIKMTEKYMSYKCDEGDTAIFEAEF